VGLGGLLTVARPPGRGFAGTAFRPFLHHIAKGKAQPGRAIKLAAGRPLPQVLTAGAAQAVLDACEHLRDRLLLGLQLDTGVGVGEALGLRHEDMDIGGCLVNVVPRENANGGPGQERPAACHPGERCPDAFVCRLLINHRAPYRGREGF
jgi:hypothetical protein